MTIYILTFHVLKWLFLSIPLNKLKWYLYPHIQYAEWLFIIILNELKWWNVILVFNILKRLFMNIKSVEMIVPSSP